MVATDIAHLDLALPAPRPRPAAEADKVYAVFASKGELLGVMTSPVYERVQALTSVALVRKSIFPES